MFKGQPYYSTVVAEGEADYAMLTVCLSVCLSVCLRTRLWTDLHQIFRVGWSRNKDLEWFDIQVMAYPDYPGILVS